MIDKQELIIDYRNSSCISVKGYEGTTIGKHIVIPDGVDQIAADAFAGCVDIESVVFPDSIRLIEDRAFKGCINLKTIKFTGKPDLQRMVNDAFDDCPKLIKDNKFIVIDNMLVKYVVLTVSNMIER